MIVNSCCCWRNKDQQGNDQQYERSYFFIFRYVDANVKRSSEYRAYNQDLPKWLNNKPPSFSKHCREGVEVARLTPCEFVTKVAENKFVVKSKKIGEKYEVNFGNVDDKVPSCQCKSLEKVITSM